MTAPQYSFLDPQALARLSRQFIHARLPMEGGVSGHHKSPHRGSSVEFAEYRKYAPGDDIRRLDWRVYARTDRFFIREFEADTNLRGYFVLDCSGSMNYVGEHGSKLDYARRLIATIAYLVAQQGDAVGLQCYADRTLHDIPPKRNAAHLRHIFDTLAKVGSKSPTTLPQNLHDLAEKIRQRALIIIFSDFFCDVEELLGAFQHLRFRKHDLALFHLLDRSELEFKFERPVRFLDLESPGSMLAEPAVIRANYLAALNEFLERIETDCNRFNADYRRVLTDEDYEKVIAQFLLDRERLAATQGKK